MDYFVLACEILFVVFTIYYTVEEVIEVRRFRMQKESMALNLI